MEEIGELLVIFCLLGALLWVILGIFEQEYFSGNEYLKMTKLENVSNNVDIYELKRNGTFMKIFGSVVRDKKKLSFTRDSKNAFIKESRKWIEEHPDDTFFVLFEDSFVAVLSCDSGGVNEFTRRLEGNIEWNVTEYHKLLFVLPQNIPV